LTKYPRKLLNGYDQAGNLTSVERPKEGEVSEIKDTYAYDGQGLPAVRTARAEGLRRASEERVPPRILDAASRR
jgi:hypothetical protein